MSSLMASTRPSNHLMDKCTTVQLFKIVSRRELTNQSDFGIVGTPITYVTFGLLTTVHDTWEGSEKLEEGSE